jgi:hypothetical protein
MTSLALIRNKLREIEFIKRFYRRMRARFIATVYRISPLLLAKLRFLEVYGRMPKLKSPQTFDEKLLWLMLFWRHSLKTQCGDKYTMRDYVKEHGLEHVLPELLGVYEHSSEIDFNALPQRFVLKCTHGCGFNIICKNKSESDLEDIKRRLDTWMKVDFGKRYGEVHYSLMQPRIICERFLDDLSGEVPVDYKVYCFDGKVHCTMACAERGAGERAKFYFYDLEWKNKLPYNETSLLAGRNIPKPDAYDEIINVAEKLSKPFPFVRMDFYSINAKAMLGEMTFTPADCIDPRLTDIAQRALGELIDLPEKLLK